MAPDAENEETNKELTVREAANYLGVSARRIRQLILDGRVEATLHPTPNKAGYYTLRRDALAAVRSRPTGRPITTGAGLRKRRKKQAE